MEMPVIYPKTLNHIAISVPDLDKAIKWYKEIFGFDVVRGPVEFVADESLAFHICITDPNIEELCKKISESGGKQRTKIWEIVPDKSYKIAFCEDPFGNIIEIYTHSYELTITSLL